MPTDEQTNRRTDHSPRRLALIGSLYVSQAVPLGFIIIAVPNILRREGLGLEGVGLLGGLALPWLLKFLWAPLVDRFGSARFGHYRSWIVPLQVLSVLAVAALALVDVRAGFTGLLVAAAVFMLCSATQDVATDGLAVRIVSYEGRGAANGIQVGGYYLGQIVGGGLVLVVFGRFGWTAAVMVMAVVLAIPLLPIAGFREPPVPAADRSAIGLRTLGRFLARPGAGIWVLVLLTYRAGEGMAWAMVNPMLVDLGLSVEEVALLLGLAGSFAALGGALLGGALVGQLGRKLSLVIFGVIQAAAICAYVVPASGLPSPVVLAVAVVLATGAGGMATAALYTNMMDRSDRRSAATDFTIQQSLCAVGPLLGAALSGFSAKALGYAPHFLLCALVALASAGLVLLWLRAETAAPEEVPSLES